MRAAAAFTIDLVMNLVSHWFWPFFLDGWYALAPKHACSHFQAFARSTLLRRLSSLDAAAEKANVRRIFTQAASEWIGISVHTAKALAVHARLTLQ